YFCSEHDALWNASDKELARLGARELVHLGLVKREDILDATVVRMKKAYPVYDETYAASLQQIRKFTREFGNLQLVGRNGMHRYNNKDHSMLTAMLAVRNICGAHYDLWCVNADTDYHEEGALITSEEAFAMEQSQPPHPPQFFDQPATTSSRTRI